MLRIGWAQDPETLNPFVGLDEEDYTVWAMNWDLLVNFSPKDLSPAPGHRQELDGLRRQEDDHLQARPGREVVRRQADHLRGRQVVARACSATTALLFTSYTDERHQDRHAATRHGRDPHHAARTRGSSAASSSTSCPKHIWGKVPVKKLTGTYKPKLPLVGSGPVHRHRVPARARSSRMERNPNSAGTSRPSTRSSTSSTATRTRSSARCSSARSTSSSRSSRSASPAWASETNIETVRAPHARPSPSSPSTSARRSICPDAKFNPAVQDRDRAPGDRLRDRPRADQHDRRAAAPRSPPTGSCPTSTSPSTSSPRRTTRSTPTRPTRSSTTPGWEMGDDGVRDEGRRDGCSSTSTCARSRLQHPGGEARRRDGEGDRRRVQRPGGEHRTSSPT